MSITRKALTLQYFLWRKVLRCQPFFLWEFCLKIKKKQENLRIFSGMNIDDFWERVKLQLRAHKITRRQFAGYISVPYSTLNSWLYNKRSVEVGTAYDIATALGVSLEYLVTGLEGKSAEERAKQVEVWKTAGTEMKRLVVKMQEEVGKL